MYRHEEKWGVGEESKHISTIHSNTSINTSMSPSKMTRNTGLNDNSLVFKTAEALPMKKLVSVRDLPKPKQTEPKTTFKKKMHEKLPNKITFINEKVTEDSLLSAK